MRLLIISDVHANIAALEKLDEPADKIVFLGDAVNYGHRPKECVDWLRKHADFAVQGNHDYGIGQNVDLNFGQSLRDSITDTYSLDRSVLTLFDRQYLRELPMEAQFRLGGVKFYAVHASPRDPLYGYLRANMTDAEWEREIGSVYADVIVLGHTHIPMVRRVGSKLIVNPGSLGVQEGDDPRGAYAIWEDGDVQIKRQD